MNRRVALAALLSLTCVASAGADDWPQWRGPERTGVSKETNLLKKWPEKGPRLAWTFKNAGLGFSSFAVVKDMLYTLGTRGKDEIVVALDAKTGTERWFAKIGSIFDGSQWGNGPRSTPTIDGMHLYALGAQGILVCLDVADGGKEIWRKDLVKEMGGVMMSEWGFTESPLVDGDRVICTPGGKQGTVAALDKKTGKEIWRTKELKNLAPYTSAVIAELQGVRQYIQASAVEDKKDGVLSGIAADSGKVLWSTPLFTGSSYSISSSILVVDGIVYITYLSDTTTNCHAFAIGPGFKVEDRYTGKNLNSLKNWYGGVVLVDGKIYGHSSGQGWVCQDFKSGKQLWVERESLSGSAGIIAAEGCLYLLSEQGEVVLLEANPKDWTEIDRFSLPQAAQKQAAAPSRKIWSHPAIANGHLFLRDAELVFCYDIRAGK